VSDGEAAAGHDALAHFVEKWLAREPEMRFADPFFAPVDRARARAWGALLHELRESMFELGDPGVARAKTAWWAEELLRAQAGEPRHPVTASLPSDAPWQALARAIVALPADAERSATTAEAIARLEPAARAMCAVEAALFGAQADADAARSVAAHWLLHRLPRGLADDDLARLPMHLLARHALTAGDLPTAKSRPLLRDWGAELLAAAPLPLSPATAFFRRARHRLDRQRLRALARTGLPSPPSPPGALWQAWRAARGS
jgi:hypothetical protein